MTDSILTVSTLKNCFLGPPEILEGEKAFILDALKELVMDLKDKPAFKHSPLALRFKRGR